QARAAGRVTGVRFGSYRALLLHPRWGKYALMGLLLWISGVIGLWGIGFFSPELINDVIGRALAREGVSPDQLPGRRTMWTGFNMILQNIGAFFGMLAFTWGATRFGRRPV